MFDKEVYSQLMTFILSLRFGVAMLSLIALIWSVEGILHRLRRRRRRMVTDPIGLGFHVATALIAGSLLLLQPVNIARMLSYPINPVTNAALIIIGLVLTCIFFFVSQVVRLNYLGDTTKGIAIKVTMMGLGTVALMVLGAFIDAKSF